jgi:HD-like signal output (HDOD) protein
MDNHPIIRMIQESKYLPEIPKEFGEGLQLLLRPYDYYIDDCVNILSKIKGIEDILIKTLKYKTNNKIQTLKDAVVYLGAKNTRMIAIAYITRLMLPDKQGRTKEFNRKIYWKHCLGTSMASYFIATKTGLCDRDKMFTYGLIHDIGITVLDICLPDYLDRIYTTQKQQGLHLIIAEKKVLEGITHADIGMWICKKWGLPDEICDIVGYHHTPFINKSSDEVVVMHLADSISTIYYEKLLGSYNSAIYFDKTRELLKLSKDFVEKLVLRLPQEVDRISKIIDFEF